MKPSLRDIVGLLLASRPCAKVSSLVSALYEPEALIAKAVGELEVASDGAVELRGNEVCVRDPVSLAIAGVKSGIPEDELARHLDWRDFEAFAAKVLNEAGLEVLRNVVSRVPRFEVDVVGVGDSIAVAIDCKRWSYSVSSPSRVAEAARAQVRRARLLAEHGASLGLPRGCRTLVPALLLLREGLPPVLEGSLVIPASALRTLIDVMYEALGDERVAKFRACW